MEKINTIKIKFEGKKGSGKSHLLNVIKHILKEKGYDVKEQTLEQTENHILEIENIIPGLIGEIKNE